MTGSGRTRQGWAGSFPPRFEEALHSVRDTPRPRGLVLEEVPGPGRMAPFTAALTAETVQTINEVPVGSGRFVILYDPSGQRTWQSDFRMVAMVRARLDEDLHADPLLSSAAWSWLTDSLADARADYHALVGTVTRVLSETFGELDLSDACGHAEIRASWSPNTPDLGPHLTAWYELILMASGHEPALVRPLSLAGTPR
ncbi:DUF3000 domain-containing protein [Actinomyces wuliandei]|uniref:DUF3000 domain-containing protein n=1 Tax=Actinomyces wuliandei TaxID=2057743 RepID=UPI001FA96CED|nr:DUF3000 domain-containing protein [Actinomyces wuliandei]